MKSGTLHHLVTILALISSMGLQGIQAESIQCYTCTDQGDGGCLPDKAMNVTCPEDQDMCVETITAIKTSHDNHVVLKKGCGYGDPTVATEKSLQAYGISIYMKLNQCNSSLCNSDMDLKDYRLAPENNASEVANNDQCYSCVGTIKGVCSTTCAPYVSCYDPYSNCFDGKVNISIGNDTTLIPVKSCAKRYRCGKRSLTHSSFTTEIMGACCSDNLCNMDLSNKTHISELPYLVLLNSQNEEVTTVVVPPQWLPPETEAPPTNSSILRDGDSSRYVSQGNEANMVRGLSFSLWLFLTLISLS